VDVAKSHWDLFWSITYGEQLEGTSSQNLPAWMSTFRESISRFIIGKSRKTEHVLGLFKFILEDFETDETARRFNILPLFRKRAKYFPISTTVLKELIYNIPENTQNKLKIASQTKQDLLQRYFNVSVPKREEKNLLSK
jgi:hypothetical protein